MRHPRTTQSLLQLAVSTALLFVFAYFLVTLLGGCATVPVDAASGIRNFKQVAPGVYRGGQPETAAQWQYIRKLGLTNDVKLNDGEEFSDRGALDAGMTLYYYPIDTFTQLVTGPSATQMSNVVAVIKRGGTYFHCERGQDRTGLAAGLFRLDQGWPKERAYSEMLTNGFHPTLMGLKKFWDKQ